MGYDRDVHCDGQFHMKIIVGIRGKIWLLSQGLETETPYVANYELFKR